GERLLPAHQVIELPGRDAATAQQLAGVGLELRRVHQPLAVAEPGSDRSRAAEPADLEREEPGWLPALLDDRDPGGRHELPGGLGELRAKERIANLLPLILHGVPGRDLARAQLVWTNHRYFHDAPPPVGRSAAKSACATCVWRPRSRAGP